MHILILSQYFSPEIGATQARWDFYLRHFLKIGWKVTVVTTFPNYPDGICYKSYKKGFLEKTVDGNLTVFRTWFWEDASKSASARLKWTVSFMVSSFCGMLLSNKPDAIIVENPPIFTGFPASILGSIWKVPVITHLSDLWIEAAINFGFLKPGFSLTVARLFERIILRCSTKVVTVTERLAKYLQARIDSGKIALIQNGVDIELYKKKSVSKSVFENFRDGFRVVYAGTMGFQHGLDVVVKAAEILQFVNPAVQFIFIGEGSEKERIMRLSSDKNLNNIVFFAQKGQEDLCEALNLCHVGLSTLKKANFTEGVRPVKIFTYMACELPIIATDIGESAEIIRAGGCGLLVEPENPQAIADAVIDLYRRFKLGDVSIGKAGREFVENHYSREYSARKLVSLLECSVWK